MAASGQPVAAEVGCYRHSSERKLFSLMLPQFKPDDLFLLDRGLGEWMGGSFFFT